MQTWPLSSLSSVVWYVNFFGYVGGGALLVVVSLLGKCAVLILLRVLNRANFEDMFVVANMLCA